MVYLRCVGRETDSEAVGITGASENAGGKDYDGRRLFFLSVLNMWKEHVFASCCR